MNYLAHLFFAQNNALSKAGNLMGDFTKGIDQSALPMDVLKGIQNHRMVDKFTDNHTAVKNLKPLLSAKRKRFSGIISDVVFDHFLVKHWSKYSDQQFSQFVQQSYQYLANAEHLMPEPMHDVVTRMRIDDWLSHYHCIDVTGRAIDSIARRIRFENHLAGAIDEVKDNYLAYEQSFLIFFPDLIEKVKFEKIEHY
ncbi:ACP phosphodiesterase [Colwelliaceae bacterium BS250]